MPPREIFHRADVIAAAFDLVAAHGVGVLSARKVSEALNCSTAPIYSHFGSMQELALEVVKKAKEQLVEATKVNYTDRVFLNMGTGLALFARDQPQLFKALFLEGDTYRDVIDEFVATLSLNLRRDRRFAHLGDQERSELLTKMWIFTHGLATLLCVGISPQTSEAYIVDTLDQVGTAVIKPYLERRPGGKER